MTNKTEQEKINLAIEGAKSYTSGSVQRRTIVNDLSVMFGQTPLNDNIYEYDMVIVKLDDSRKLFVGLYADYDYVSDQYVSSAHVAIRHYEKENGKWCRVPEKGERLFDSSE